MENLYIVTRGQVESVLASPAGQELGVSNIGMHQYFGEAALMDGCISQNTFRAGKGREVEVATLPKDIFKKLISESESTRQEVTRVAAQRTQQHGNANGASKK